MNNGGMTEKISRWSTLLLCGLLPFLFVPAEWISVAQGKTLLVIVLVVIATVAWIASALSNGVLRVPRSSLLLAVFLVPVAYLASALATGISYTALVGGGFMQDTVVNVLIMYALFVACVHAFGAGVGRFIRSTQILLLGGVVVLCIQIFHLVWPSITFGGVLAGQASSVIGSWHDLAIFLGLLLFLSLAFIPSPLATNRVWKLILILTAILSAALLVIINLRDVIIALGVLCAVYVAYLWFASRGLDEMTRRTFIRRSLWWLALIVALVGLYFGGNAIHNALPSPLQVTRIEVRPSWQGTFAVGSQVFTQPSTIFFGTGPNTFPREWGMHKPLSVNETQFWNIDFYSGVGFIPTSFVTVGFLGVIAWAAVCLALLVSVWRLFMRRSDFAGMNLLRAGVVGSAAYLTAFHILYVPGPALSALTFILFGAVVAIELLGGVVRDRTWSLSFSSWQGRVGSIILIVFAFLVLFGGIQSTRALVSDILVNRGVSVYNADGDLAKASQSVEQALLVWPGNDRAYRAAVELGILQFEKLAAAGATDEASFAELQKILSSTVQHGLTAVTVGGANYQNWLSLARLYGRLAGVGVQGAEERARSAYEETFKNNPTNPLPLLELAQMELLAGDDASAREYLSEALSIKPNLAVTLFLLSQIDARAGDLPAAREKAEKVVIFAPDDSLGWYNLGIIYYAEASYENAALAFERAVGIQNDYSNALFFLSASYAYLERYGEAETALKAVATLNPENTSLPDMVKVLGEGKNPFANPKTTTK